MTITSENFKELAQSGKPMVIDFWATWCGPCRRLGPIVEELAKEYEGRVNIGKCDVEEDENLAVDYRVTSIPCVVFFDKQGNEVSRLVGLQNKANLIEKIEALL